MAEKHGERPERASLCVTRGFYEGLELPIDREWIIIGRGHEANYVIPDATLSRAHAAVGCSEEGYFIQDLSSTNGTLVNGIQQSRSPLRDGDEIQLGKLYLRAHVFDGAAQPSRPAKKADD